MSDSENKVIIQLQLNEKIVRCIKVVGSICQCNSVEETIKNMVLNYLNNTGFDV